jgi:hypothetical protein
LAYIKIKSFPQAEKSAHSWDSLARLKAHFPEIPSGQPFQMGESFAQELCKRPMISLLGKRNDRLLFLF